MAGDGADPGRERDAGRVRRVALAIEAAGEHASHRQLAGVRIGARHDDRELVAADPEGPVRATQVAGHGRRGVTQQDVADRVAAGVVDPLEVVEVDDGERQRLVVADRAGPLALHLLLEGAVVAQPGQRVAERLGARPVVGVLEDPAGALEPLGGLQDPSRQPDRERAEDAGQGEQGEGRQDERGTEAPGQPVDHRRRDHDRDREHGDEREEQAKPDQLQVGRFAEDVVGGRVVVDGHGSGCGRGRARAAGVGIVIARRPSGANAHRGTPAG